MSEKCPVTLTAKWFLKPDLEKDAHEALDKLAEAVRANEPDTLMYLVRTPFTGGDLQSLPPADPGTVVFLEMYRNADAFHAHVNGPVFTDFVKKHGDLFVTANGTPFVLVEFLSRRAGFIREEALETPSAAKTTLTGNRHPAVMFEFIAKDQGRLKSFYQEVFDWDYTSSPGDPDGKEFVYIEFSSEVRNLFGGIAQSQDEAGYEPGHYFYLLVDSVDATMDQAEAAGGTRHMEPVTIDPYRIAMFNDPEGNTVGLIQNVAADTNVH